eukprot:SAG31_NODE_16983_length_687_cov_45.768707_2_plen_173_part_00
MEPAGSRVVPPIPITAGTRGAVPRVAVQLPPASTTFESASFRRGGRIGPRPYGPKSGHFHGMAGAAKPHRRYAERAGGAAEQRTKPHLCNKTMRGRAALAPPRRCDADRLGGPRKSVGAHKAAPLPSTASWAGAPRRADFGLQDEGGSAARQRGRRSLCAPTDLRPMGWVSG